MEAHDLQLIDDAWLYIFSYLNTRNLAELAEVSKKWRDLLRRPAAWKQVEISMPRKFNSDYRKENLFFDHLLKYCNAVTDLHLTLGSPVAQLDEILQIKTLERLVFKWESGSLPEKILVRVPACRGLRLLNLNFLYTFDDEQLSMLLLGLPNLKELYFGKVNRITSFKPFAFAKNLQRLSFSPTVSMTDEELINLCPSLKFVVKWSQGRSATFTFRETLSDERNGFKKIGETLVLSNDILRSLTEDQLKQVAPILTPHMASSPVPYLSALIADNTFSERIRYLVKELHFDVNGRLPKYPYRPSFIEMERVNIDPTILDPVHYALGNYSTAALETLLELGASPESPADCESYFIKARTPDKMMLLLKYGADPNRVVKLGVLGETVHLPVFAAGLRLCTRDLTSKYSFLDVINELARLNCDLNIAVMGQTLLETLIINDIVDVDDLIPAMFNAGVQFTSASLALLANRYPKKFEEMLNKSQIEPSALSVQLMANAIHKGMSDSLGPFMEQKKKEVDHEGLTLLHHLMLQHPKFVSNNTERVSRPGPRWQTSVPQPSQKHTCFTSFTKPSPPSLLTAASFQLSSTGSDSSTPASYIAKSSFGSYSFSASDSTPVTRTGSALFSQKPVVAEPQQNQALTIELLNVLRDSINIQSNIGETVLLSVCKSSHLHRSLKERVEMLLSIGADVNIADNNGWTPLHAALYAGHWEIARLLMKHGANINAQDGFGVTSLMAALFGFKHFFKHENVDQDCLEFLKDERVDISLKTKYLGQTLLHLAACIGSEALGEVVTSHALCDINSRDANGFTPLHYAVMFDNYHMIPLLIKKGADCNAQTTSLRLTPAMMFLVMTSSDSPYKQYLENYNVLMFASRSKEKNAYPKRYEAPWNVVGDLKKLHRSNDDRRRSFSTEVESPLASLWYLIDKSDCKATDVLGNTVLHFLLPYSNFNGRDIMDNVSRYRQHESLFQTMWGKRNYFHNSPFSLLCRHLTESTFNRSTTSMLHDIAKNIGGDLNEPDSRGITSLHYILKMPLSVHEKTPFFDIPGVDMVGDIRVLSNFLSAVLDQQKSASVVSYGVLERLVQANINSVNAYGLTTLMHLVVKCSSDTSKEFWRVTGSVISSGKANINAQDEKGNTALHFACMFYHNGMLESIFGNLGNQLESASFFLLPFKLLDAGADPTIKNNDGETPLVYAPPLMDHYEGLYKEWLRDYSMKKIL